GLVRVDRDGDGKGGRGRFAYSGVELRTVGADEIMAAIQDDLRRIHVPVAQTVRIVVLALREFATRKSVLPTELIPVRDAVDKRKEIVPRAERVDIGVRGRT